ncbi:MAG: hypothetical protein R3F59_13080 [Myxococcota bacterium]
MSFLNELEDPAEDITLEVDAESDQHQVLFLGSGVQSPATGDNAAAVVAIDYADTDANGLPVGLDDDVTTLGAGAGELRVVLRHMPPQDGEPVKVAGVAEDVASGGIGAAPGDSDVDVTFPVTVQ